MNEINIPIIINGRKIYDGEQYEFEYETGTKVRIPKLTPEMVNEIKAQDRMAIHDMSVAEISEFLGKVGDLWRDVNYPLRKECIRYASMVTGYSEEMITFDTLNIPEILVRPYIGDILDAELGDRNLLDEWERKGSSLIHAEPRGKLLHIMVGNVPIASVFSLVRGIITKNVNIVKLPRRDLITCLYFCLSFFDADPDCPITKSLSVCTWPGGQEAVEDEMIALADAVCVWGGEDAVSAIRPKLQTGTRLLEFGPRTSLQLVGETTAEEKREAVKGAAMDICLYDQEACFSTQVIYVKNDIMTYAGLLAEELTAFGKRFPKGFTSRDHQATIQFERQKALFNDHKVIAPENSEWTIIVTDKIVPIESHPLSRTVYIMPYEEYDEILPTITRYNQTIAVYPEPLRYEIRDRFTQRGIDRVVESGKSWELRFGSSHDGVYALRDMVRIVCMDREYSFQSRWYDPVEFIGLNSETGSDLHE